jgi:serralysin
VTGANRDQILDFKRGQGDRIDPSDIEADTSANAGNDKFKFIGTAAFKGGGGELRYTDHGPVCTVEGDTNGDKVADFEIRVNVPTLLLGDFFL